MSQEIDAPVSPKCKLTVVLSTIRTDQCVTGAYLFWNLYNVTNTTLIMVPRYKYGLECDPLPCV